MNLFNRPTHLDLHSFPTRRSSDLYPMSDVLRPFELAAGMCRMHWLSPIIIYWARRQSAQELASHARAYGDWLANPLSPGGR